MFNLFVYGTLLENELNMILEVNSYHSEIAYFNGTMYDCGRFPFVITSENPTDIITGKIYFVRDDNVMLFLDAYEGQYFKREQHIIKVHGKEIKAWVYVGNMPNEKFEQIKSGNWTEYRKEMLK